MLRLVQLAGLIALVVLAASTSAKSRGFEPIERCSYVDKGQPGPVDNELLIEADEIKVIRDGSRITVINASGKEVHCAGPVQPRVDNLDLITVAVQSIGPTIDLQGGPLAPGAAIESDGTSEIEIVVTGDATTDANVHGSKGDDAIEAGSLPSGDVGVNLSAAAEPASPDSDLTMPSGGILGISLTRGNDRLDASGGSLLPAANIELFVYGMGPNADVVIGGAKGGAIVGGPGRDRIVGGAGSERIGAGPGDDTILVKGGRKDRVQCGGGEDAYKADRRDDVELCERLLRN